MDEKTKLAIDLDQTNYLNMIASLTAKVDLLTEENKKLSHALLVCKEKFDFMRTIRGSDGALCNAVIAVEEALNNRAENLK